MTTATTNPTRQRYVVEGVYLGGNEGSPITADYVVAASPEEAEKIVSEARNRTDDWVSDRVMTFEEHHAREVAALAEMIALSVESVESGWADTKANLGIEDEDEDEEVGDDLCDFCMSSGVHVERTVGGKTVGIECGCDAVVDGEDKEDEAKPAADPYAQWSTRCPHCGVADQLRVVSVRLVATGRRTFPRTLLKADGFVVDPRGTHERLKDQSTDEEQVECEACRKRVALDALALDAQQEEK